MNKGFPLISVALATYKGEKFLREQLDSIFAQSYKNIEVVACDDCSTDNTISILKEYSQKCGLKYFQNEENLGFVKNFEKAISLCTGEFIALSDQDDVWEKNKLEILMSKIGESDLIFSDARLINDRGEIFQDSFMTHNLLSYSEANQFERLLYGNFIQGASILFSSSLKKDILPIPEGIPYHDWWIVLISSAQSVLKYTATPLINYRIHERNNTGINPFSNYSSIEWLNNYDSIDLKKRNSVINAKKMLDSAKVRFDSQKLLKQIKKAEFFFNALSYKGRNIFKRILCNVYINLFYLRNKYIFKPDMSYYSYIKSGLVRVLLSNSATIYFYKKYQDFR